MVMEWNDLVHRVPIHCNYFVKVFGAQIEGKGSLTRYQPEYNTQQSYRNVFHKENVKYVQGWMYLALIKHCRLDLSQAYSA